MQFAYVGIFAYSMYFSMGFASVASYIIKNKSVQSNLGTGPRRGGLSGPWAVQHCAVVCIHEYASCPSAAAAAVIGARAATVCCLLFEFW